MTLQLTKPSGKLLFPYWLETANDAMESVYNQIFSTFSVMTMAYAQFLAVTPL